MPYAKALQHVVLGIPPALLSMQQQTAGMSNVQAQQQRTGPALSPGAPYDSNQAAAQISAVAHRQTNQQTNVLLSHTALTEPPTAARSYSTELGTAWTVSQQTHNTVSSSMQPPSRQSSSSVTLQHSRKNSIEDSCPICFCDYEAMSLVKQLPCRHFYHSGKQDLMVSGSQRFKNVVNVYGSCSGAHIMDSAFTNTPLCMPSTA